MYQWISWYQPTEDYRPLNYPPREEILGWWCSGYAGLGEAATLCAMVKADDEESAKEIILSEWPEAEKWRFCEARESPAQRGGRFVPAGWMVERFDKAANS